MAKRTETVTDENNNYSIINEIFDTQQKKKKQYSTSLEKYSKGLIISRNSGFKKLKPNLEHLKKIFFSIDNFKSIYPYLIDKDGGLNVRYSGREKKSFLLFFLDDVDIYSLCEKAKKSFETIRKTIFPGYHSHDSYSIRVYQGKSPLDSRTNIRVTVLNPDPEANKEYYEDFGEIADYKRINGVDHISFMTLKLILPILHAHTKWIKNIKGKVYFFLDPKEENKAAPLYCITTKVFKLPKDFDVALAKFKELHPRHRLVSHPKTTKVSLNSPVQVDAQTKDTSNGNSLIQDNKTNIRDIPNINDAKKKSRETKKNKNKNKNTRTNKPNLDSSKKPSRKVKKKIDPNYQYSSDDSQEYNSENFDLNKFDPRDNFDTLFDIGE